jgi:hypothetical protein
MQLQRLSNNTCSHVGQSITSTKKTRTCLLFATDPNTRHTSDTHTHRNAPQARHHINHNDLKLPTFKFEHPVEKKSHSNSHALTSDQSKPSEHSRVSSSCRSMSNAIDTSSRSTRVPQIQRGKKKKHQFFLFDRSSCPKRQSLAQKTKKRRGKKKKGTPFCTLVL